jgi:hypothetical protein
MSEITVSISNVTSQGLVLTISPEIALSGGLASKEWWVSWERLGAILALGLEARSYGKEVLRLLDEGLLCRDISRDHEPDWVKRATDVVAVLKGLQAAVERNP